MEMAMMQRKKPTASPVWLERAFLPEFIGKTSGFWKPINLKNIFEVL